MSLDSLGQSSTVKAATAATISADSGASKVETIWVTGWAKVIRQECNAVRSRATPGMPCGRELCTSEEHHVSRNRGLVY